MADSGLAAYDLQHISPLCAELTSCGIVTCSLEYRRVGQEGGGWPGTFGDVANGTEHFRQLLIRDRRVDMGRAAVMGHSAGGHLALWLGGSHRLPKSSALHVDQKPWLTAVISLAGVADLRNAWVAPTPPSHHQPVSPIQRPSPARQYAPREYGPGLRLAG